MIYTVALERLDRVRERDSSGKRIYVTSKATAADIEAIEAATLNGLGLRKFLK